MHRGGAGADSRWRVRLFHHQQIVAAARVQWLVGVVLQIFKQQIVVIIIVVEAAAGMLLMLRDNNGRSLFEKDVTVDGIPSHCLVPRRGGSGIVVRAAGVAGTMVNPRLVVLLLGLRGDCGRRIPSPQR